MNERPETAHDVVTRDELAQVLFDVHTALRAEMREHLLSLHGMTCSAQLYTVEHIARKFGITLERKAGATLVTEEHE